MRVIALLVQPSENVSHFDTTVVLDGQRVTFAFYTNTVDGGWYWNASLDDGTVIANGVGLATGVDLLYPYRYLDGCPPGPLWIKDKGLGGEDPDLTAFSEGRCALVYGVAEGA